MYFKVLDISTVLCVQTPNPDMGSFLIIALILMSHIYSTKITIVVVIIRVFWGKKKF